MSRHTAIQWCDSTVNPVMGCDGCELWNARERSCYAGVLHARYAGTNKGYARDFDAPETFPGRMDRAACWSDLTGTARPDKPWLDGLPRTIFISDMGDALSASIPFEYLYDEVIGAVRTEQGLRHRWLWLTKRPNRMAKFAVWLYRRGVAWPANLWPMTSVTGNGNERRVHELLRASWHTDRQPINFALSCEPLRSEPTWEWVFQRGVDLGMVKWAIFGGQSGPHAPSCQLEWIRRGNMHARGADVAVFNKQLGASVEMSFDEWNEHTAGGLGGDRFTLLTVGGDRGLWRPPHTHGGDWSEWPEDLRVREVPR